MSGIRYALRTLIRDGSFSVVAILIIGLGIGANTAIFSVVNTLLLRPLPFHEPESLVWVANTGKGGLSEETSRTSNLRDYESKLAYRNGEESGIALRRKPYQTRRVF